MAHHASPVTGTSVSFEVGSREVTTRLTYATADDGPTAHGLLPHHSPDGQAACDLGAWPTVYGTLELCAGRTLEWSVPRMRPRAELDLARVSSTQRKELATLVRADVKNLPDPPADTYFGGKHAYRTAQLLSIASQVGAGDAEKAAREHLTDLMLRWGEIEGCASRQEFCFGYAAEWKGVVGRTPSFGSELFNDHHFHYGYFLFAVAVLATHDPKVIEPLTPVMTLLAADVAGGEDTGLTPQWRPFDVYASHSWASGTSDFADGNNQGVLLRGGDRLGGTRALGARGRRRGSRASGGLDARVRGARCHSVLDRLRRGRAGVRSVRTLGDGAQLGREAGLRHLVLPGALSRPRDPVDPHEPHHRPPAWPPDRIRTNVRDVESGPLSDYVTMYAGLAGPADAREALRKARALDPDDIDQGNSRSYLVAFLMSLAPDD